MKKARRANNSFQLVKKLSYYTAFCCLSGLSIPLSNAHAIANSDIDLKKDVENIKQKNFKNKDNLDPRSDSLGNQEILKKS